MFRFDLRVDKESRYQYYEVHLVDGMSVLDVLDYLDPSLAYCVCAVCRYEACGRRTLAFNCRTCVERQTPVTEDITIEPAPKSRVIIDIIYEVVKQ